MKLERPTQSGRVERVAACPDCGVPITVDDTGEPRCGDCLPIHRLEVGRGRIRGTPAQRGYDKLWERLSKRARRLQPWCSDCGATDDLSTDHSTAAWQARAAGRSITLDMVDVVCLRCNGERGAARGETATDEYRNRDRDQFHRIATDETAAECDRAE